MLLLFICWHEENNLISALNLSNLLSYLSCRVLVQLMKSEEIISKTENIIQLSRSRMEITENENFINQLNNFHKTIKLFQIWHA